jgi:hypothetical protein
MFFEQFLTLFTRFLIVFSLFFVKIKGLKSFKRYEPPPFFSKAYDFHDDGRDDKRWRK